MSACLYPITIDHCPAPASCFPPSSLHYLLERLPQQTLSIQLCSVRVRSHKSILYSGISTFCITKHQVPAGKLSIRTLPIELFYLRLITQVDTGLLIPRESPFHKKIRSSRQRPQQQGWSITCPNLAFVHHYLVLLSHPPLSPYLYTLRTLSRPSRTFQHPVPNSIVQLNTVAKRKLQS